MASCCYQHEVCYPYGSDCCFLEPNEAQSVKRASMFERQGIFPSVGPQRTSTPEDNYRHQTRQYWHPPAFVGADIPSIIISEDLAGPFLSSHTNGESSPVKTVRNVFWMSEGKSYCRNRGPILRVTGPIIADTVLTFKDLLKLEADGTPVPSKTSDEFHPQVEDLFVCEGLEFAPFSTTKMCKETRFLTLKNEGTVAVRYQWLRSPPTRAMRKILARPGNVLNPKKLRPLSDEPSFWKDDSFEFHFRELPGVLLPGQTAEVPIIFRPRRNGYFYENMYLLTQPRLSDQNDKILKIRLSGICMDPDCPQPHSNQSQQRSNGIIKPEKILRMMRFKMLFYEATDTLDTILDIILYNDPVPKSSLPNGHVTAEQIFQAHNPDLLYRYNSAEKALQNVRSLVQDLVPKERIIQNSDTCPLSISKLYKEIGRVPAGTKYFWDNFKSPEIEDRLEQLLKETQSLVKPRVFSWIPINSRIYSACYATVVSTVDEILARITNIDYDCTNVSLKRVLTVGMKEKLLKRKEKERRRQLRRAERLERKRNPGQKVSRENYLDPGSRSEHKGSASREEGSKRNLGVDSASMKEFESSSASKEELDIVIPDEEIESELQEWESATGRECKQILFETIFGCSIERMMSVVDSYRAIEDYSESGQIQPCERGGYCT